MSGKAFHAVRVGAGARRVPAGGGAGLGDAVRARHEGPGRRGGRRHLVAPPVGSSRRLPRAEPAAEHD